MVDTVKFSEFAQGVLSNPTNSLVGVSSSFGGANIQIPFPLSWDISTRPISPTPGTFGYNTSLSQIEYWNGVSWLSLAAGGVGTVNLSAANQIAYYPFNGTTISGLTTQNNAGLFTNNSGVPSMVVSTGTGQPVRNNNPTLINPILGNANASSVEFLTTAGIIGTFTNNDADVGSVGEFVSSVIPFGSSVSLVSSVPKNLTSILLHSGDWDVWGNITFNSLSSSISSCSSWLSKIYATVPDPSMYSILEPNSSLISKCTLNAPMQRFSLSSITTIYISGSANFSSSASMCGGIYARVRR